jgi:hypothetical protein
MPHHAPHFANVDEKLTAAQQSKIECRLKTP